MIEPNECRADHLTPGDNFEFDGKTYCVDRIAVTIDDVAIDALQMNEHAKPQGGPAQLALAAGQIVRRRGRLF